MANYYAPIDVENSVGGYRSLVLPYQKEAIDSLNEYYCLDEDRPVRRGVVVMPTGSGKTFTTVSWLMNEAIPRGYKVLWLVHRVELVDQAYHEFCNCSPILKKYGIKKIHVTPYSSVHAELATCISGEISVCCIQSLSNLYGFRKIKMLLGSGERERLIVVIDEAHHGISGTYRKVLNKIGELCPNYILLGLTATPFRTSDSEQDKLNALYDIPYNVYERKYNKYNGYVYEVTLKQLLSQKGTLANPVYIPVDTQMKACDEYDLSDSVYEYYRTHHELSSEALSEIASCERRNMFIVDYYLKHSKEFGKTLIFALNQDHARSLCELLIDNGVSAKCAISDNQDSQLVIKEFKENKFPVLVNVQMLTEGSDVPDIQTVFLTRETNSSSLLVQMIGRGLRGTNANGTETCNIVAFHDIWDRFMTFMDPGTLPLFRRNDEEEESCEQEEVIDVVPAFMNEIDAIGVEADEEVESRAELDLKYLLELLSAQVKDAADRGVYESPVSPIGWFHVELAGKKRIVLVYDCQKGAFDELSREADVRCVVKGRLGGEYILRAYFSMVDHKPTVEDLDAMARYMSVTLKMPPYYSFEQRNAIDIDSIAKQASELSSEYEKEMFLADIYRSSDLLKSIYGNQSNFEETVKNCQNKYSAPEIVYGQSEAKQRYRYVPGTHDLTSIYNELINSPLCKGLLSRPLNLKLSWSDNFVRKWYAICEWDGPVVPSTHYEIRVNKLFDSPDTDREVVKYLIYHELLHAYGYRDHSLKFRKLEWQFPNSSELDHFMDTLWDKYSIADLNVNWIGFESHMNNRTGVYENKEFSDDVEETISEQCTETRTDELDSLVEENKFLTSQIKRLKDHIEQQSKDILEIKQILQSLLAKSQK